MEKLLVIIVTYNSMKWIRACIDSLRNSTISSDIFIIDNGSTDGTQKYIKSNYKDVIFRESQFNLGFGRANNVGLNYAIQNDYEYIYLLNQDAWVMPDCFETLIEVQKKYPEFGILSPMQLQANENHFDSNFGVLISNWADGSRFIESLFFNHHEQVYPIDRIMAAHWLISKKCLLKTGGFSPTFPHYGEDYNFSDRAKYYGFRSGIVPKALAVHDRENREESNDGKIYKTYHEALVNFSSPFVENNISLLLFVYGTIKNVIRFKSLLPFRYAYKVFMAYNQIKRNKLTSVSVDCAFLGDSL